MSKVLIKSVCVTSEEASMFPGDGDMFMSSIMIGKSKLDLTEEQWENLDYTMTIGSGELLIRFYLPAGIA